MNTTKNESDNEISTKVFSLYAMNRFMSFIEEKENEVQGAAIVFMPEELRMRLVNEIIYRTREELEIGREFLKGTHYVFEEADIEKTRDMLGFYTRNI
ncbi:hypothetical protein [Dickeya sp. DW 0440]|uniref:hypothetical protein n=1 Tax=Dickeya sp. DW 0440 TaxID=1225785 RepID=UPI0005564FD2|nr:hypothetical protein [Dickeya sp. DW 0440]